MRAFGSVTKIDPTHGAAWAQLARIFARAGQPARADSALENAIKTEPRFIDNYVYKAEFYHHQEKEKEALDALDQALKMDPEAFPEERAYNRYAQKKARAHWKEWTGKEYPNR